ncbi:MAG TPA: peptidase S8/S53 subtilisin kexin sedolisin [Cyanobacteria bacterium UBA11162]|nr:peptidase S8/S53 subtilisin kexin sedolisin [Cyanobacteria bacterium UBA11162]
MKSRFSSILLAVLTWALVIVSHTTRPTFVTAQTPTSDELFYLYFDQAIALNLRQDAIAVAPKLPRTPPNSNTPFYLQLQDDLQQTGTRTSTPNHCARLQFQVQPLRSEDYALVSLPSGNSDELEMLRQCIKAHEDVEQILPILKRPDYDELLVLPNEIIINFEPKLSERQIQDVLKHYPIEIIRKLRLSGNCYLVRSTLASELAILTLANQLNNLPEIEYSAPNWIALPPSYIQLQIKRPSLSREEGEMGREGEIEEIKKIGRITNNSTPLPTPHSPLPTLFPWQWYLDSTPLTVCLQEDNEFRGCVQQLTQCLQQGNVLNNCVSSISSQYSTLPTRTDIRALEAWQQSNQGRGVVVAVIDGLIQWDHPDLRDNIYTVNHPLEPDLYPGEIHGWDFIGEDPETRLSQTEQTTLQRQLKENSPFDAEFALVSAFHGTLVTGVIAAHSSTVEGVLGVAPNVTILPVRAADMEGILDLVDEAEAIEYAANRGADIINMSFGGDPPHPLVKSAIAYVLTTHPNLVLVAGAGNENFSQKSYPAAYDGVIAVGATALTGHRAAYSNYGEWIDVVAPGGDVSAPDIYGGILTTGGTWQDEFWDGIRKLSPGQYYAFDPKGKYMWVQGTSFSTPVVSGVLGLMKGEDPNRRLNRDRLVAILKETASYDSLRVSDSRRGGYRYFFGSGLVNAEAALKASIEPKPANKTIQEKKI